MSLTAEGILPSVRALVADELARAHEFSRKQIADLLSVTPSAITQYLSGKRGGQLVGKLRSHPEIRLIVSDIANKIDSRVQTGIEPLRPMELVDISYQCLALLKGRPARGREAEKETERPATPRWVDKLRKRLHHEIVTAQNTMQLASRLDDDYLKLIFREIATDSLRHADILSVIIAQLGSGREPTFHLPKLEQLREVIAAEDGATEQPLGQAVKVASPVIRALLKSVDVDEEKHTKMLRLLLSAYSKSR